MKKSTFLIIMILLLSQSVFSQIFAPSASTYFSTNYTSGFLNSGGQNDVVFVFCADQTVDNIGELSVPSTGCTVVWYYYDGFSYSELGQTGGTATGLTSGLYMAQVDCGGTVSCYRAWVWVNQSFVDIEEIVPGCETFTLHAQASVLDDEFLINDPPGLNFEIDEDTYIQVCFWADHTYVSDLGFYLKAPGNTTTEPNNDGVVALLPAASDWGPAGEFLSNTTIPWTVTSCDPLDQNTPCNNGNGVEEFCFSTNVFLGGPDLLSTNPAHVACVCDLTTPLTGVWAPAESWARIYGFMAGDPGWAVQIYDCEEIDFGTLTMARIVFSALTDCGQTTFLYDSGEISSAINDNSCAAGTASVYVVPPSEPAGEYTVTSSITDYAWTCTGSGFTGNQLNEQIVAGTGDFPVTTSDFVLTVTETISAPGSPHCDVIASETFYTLPADATITPVGIVCANSTPFQLVAEDGGGTWTTNAPAGTIVNNIFYPEIAGGGTWLVDYEIGGPCPDDDQISITVYETIEILDFSDNVCDGLGQFYTVSFDVVNNQGNPTTFIVDYGSGTSTLSGSFTHQFPTQTSYSITVTDTHGCDEYILNGYRDCGCTTFAGTLSTTVPIQLCVGECTDMLTHNNNEILDGNDILEFIIHDGGSPQNILAYNPTEPEFCLNDISGGQAGVVYYISAIAGNNSGGHVSAVDPCYSQSMSTAVIWFQNPIANITESDIQVCGLTTHLTANEPQPGQIGTWSAPSGFLVLGGQTINDYDIDVIKQLPYGDLIFTWTVVNSICSASDNVTVHFNEQPNAYAGSDIQICGNEATLAAIISLPTSSGYWSGNGSFVLASDPETMVTSSGTQVFTWREENGTCWDVDYVNVTFIQEPQPTTTPNIDTVCGVVYDLNVFNVTGTGSWAAYEDGVLFTPAPLYIGGSNIPNPQAIVAYGTQLSVAIDFVWTETINAGVVECTNTATKRVVFSRQPVASVGSEDQAEVCGNCFEFHADTVGSGWAEGFWIAKDIILESYDDLSKPNANICIDPVASFGDTAHVDVEFLWVMVNAGCTSMDTMWLSFYQRPQANAGLDNAICGNNYELGAVYDLSLNEAYTPSGIWSVYTSPSGGSADIVPLTQDTVDVSVSHVGIWNFIFRENNTLLTSCYNTDTVQIEFVEVPVITAGEDFDVCGTHTQLDGVSGGFEGSWLPTPGAVFEDFSDPNTILDVGAYGTLTFTWLEANQATTETLSCANQDDVEVTFWRVPTAAILTDPADSTVCGLTFDHLRAESPGSGIDGTWYSINPAITYVDVFSNNTSTTVPSYGYHNFYWIESTGPTLTPGFCNDTAGPLTIRFIEIPDAYAGGDTLFCGYTGELHAIPSAGIGVWSTPSVANISFADQNNPESQVTSNVINTGNPTYPFFELIWTEDNSNGCTDKDTMQVIFARIPTSEMQIIPPKCFGEPATIAALEDTVQQYTWNFYGGLVDSISPANVSGGLAEYFIYWNDEDTAHRVSMIATNYWGCQSPINIDTIQEPPIPIFEVTMVLDTCALGKGGIVFAPTIENSFFWIDPNVGPAPGTPITEVYDLPAGEYGIRVSYLTPNIVNYSYYINTFGTANCIDTMIYEIETIGMIDAEMSISADIVLEDLVAPNATVIFLNTSDYDDVSKRCEWHFDDGTIVKNCDELIEHIYTEAGCYEPFLIVMNRDLPECRDTARLATCVNVDDASKLEIPNIFSPNGDGINDYFQVKAQTLRSFNGVILNRWGNIIFEWSNWEEYEAGWNGNMNGGSKAAPGVYFYTITAEGMDGIPYNAHGALHLMRED